MPNMDYQRGLDDARASIEADIHAARIEGARLALEAAALIADESFYCKYCDQPRDVGSQIRELSPESIVKEVKP